MKLTHTVCDECGAPATYSRSGTSLRVYIDGVDMDNSVDFCEDHKPRTEDDRQGHNCKRVKLVYLGRKSV